MRGLALEDLRISRNEPNHELVNVPANRLRDLREVQAPVDSASAGLTGRAYLEFLNNDIRVPTEVKALIAGDNMLGRPNILNEQLNGFAERLRKVMAEAYRDPALGQELARLAVEGMPACGDRTEFFLGQMEDASLLAHLTRGEIDDVTLYNHGIAFFMLDQIQAETGRLTQQLPGQGNARNSVHDYLDAIYFLQDELHLPHRQARPIYNNIGFMTRELAARIGENVRARAFHNNGEHVIDFMSTWGPWVSCLKNHEAHRADFAVLARKFAKWMTRVETARDTPGTAEEQMNEHAYIETVNFIGAQENIWQSELVGQKTDEFLKNHRADYLANEGRLPAYFG